MKHLALVAAVAFVLIGASAAFAQTSGGGSAGVAPPNLGYNANRPRSDDASYINGRDGAVQNNANYLPSGSPIEVTEAAAAAKLAGVDCKAKDGALISKGRTTTYEVACDKDFGWLVSSKDGGKSYIAYDCLALQVSAKAAHGKLGVCRLRANENLKAGATALAERLGLKCPISQYTFLGAGGTPPINRYEIGCNAGRGYIIDVPAPKSTAVLRASPCAAAPGVCTLKHAS